MSMPTVRKWTDMMESAGSEVTNEVLPAGTYDVFVFKADAKQTSTGKEMFVLTLEVESGAHAKRRIWTNMVISPDSPTAMGIFFRQMAALGLDRSFFASEPSNDAIIRALDKRRAKAIVSIKKYQGQDRNEVKNLNPPGASSLPPGVVPMTGGAPSAPPAPPAPSAPPAPPAVAAPPPPPPPAAPAAPAAPPVAATPPPPPAPLPVPETVPAAATGDLEDPPF